MPLEITEEELMQWETMLSKSPDTCVPKRMLFSLPYGKRVCNLCGHEWSVWKVSDWNKLQKCPQCGELHDLSGIPVFPRALDLAHMHYGLGTVSGLEGGGKSMTTTAIGYREKEYYTRKVCCNRPKKPAYGHHEVVTSEDFIRELKLLSRLTEEYDADAKAGKAWDEEKVFLRYSQESCIYNSVYDNDEFHLVLHAATRTRESRFWGDFAKQWRHYHILVLAQTPNADELDVKLWDKRLTHDITCYKSENTTGLTIAKIFNRRMGMVVNTLDIEHAKWGKLFYTHNPPNVRKDLSIEMAKGKELIITTKTDAEIIEAIKEKVKDANPKNQEILFKQLIGKDKMELLKMYREVSVVKEGDFEGDIAFTTSKSWR